MREAMFIKKNAAKWQAYQHHQTDNPDETAERFVELIDDLSYAKTFYPKSKVTRWINGITASIYQNIYKNKKEKYSRVFLFWKYELPLLFKKYHGVFLFTTVIFVLFVAIGYFSSMQDPAFVRGVLGDAYVDKTEDLIASGDPFGIYSSQSSFNMFIRIAFNNISVALKTFLGGFTVGIFTFVAMWSNGIMLGSFQHLFFSNGMGLESILVVWIHGTIEIASIIIAGAAGFILANGILFPGTYTRLASFKRSMKDAAKILIALIPFFIIAAFLEGYITRMMSETYRGKGTGLPAWGSVLILASSLALVIWYFVILPIKLSRRGIYLGDGGIVSRLKQGNV